LDTTRIEQLEECDDFVRGVVGCDFGVFKYAPWDKLIEDICSPDEDALGDSDSVEGGTRTKGRAMMVKTTNSGKETGTTTRRKGKGVEKSVTAMEKTTAPRVTTGAQVKSKGKATEKGKVDKEEGQWEDESEVPEPEVRTASYILHGLLRNRILRSRSSSRARAVRSSRFRAFSRARFVVKGAQERARSATRSSVGDVSVIELL
jgi:hypothetical protein